MYNFLRTIAARYGGYEHEYLFHQKWHNFYGAESRPFVKPGFHLWSDHVRLRQIIMIGAPQAISESFKLTLVRNPLDRCLSAFYYYICTRTHTPWDMIPEDDMMKHKLEFHSCGGGKKTATQMMEIAPSGASSTVEEALAFYNFIGVTERFMESLTVIKMLLGLRYGDMLYFDSKVSGSRNDRTPHPTIAEEPEEFVTHLKTLIGSEDEELFAAANNMLTEIIANLEPEFSVVHDKVVKTVNQARFECGDQDDRPLLIAEACFTYGHCRLSCLNKFATDHDLWDVPIPVTVNVTGPVATADRRQ
ncbi:unnamed protein product [Discosporangium mesarthrocarpum]